MTLSFTIATDADLLVKIGQKVNFNDPLTKKKSSEEVTIPLSSLLGLRPNAIFKSLKHFVGEIIHKGDLIAQNKGLLSTKNYFSETDGIIKEVNHQDGSLIIEKISPEESMSCFFKGEIVDVKGKTITLKVGKYAEYLLKQASEDFGGEVGIMTNEEVEGKVLLAERIQPYETVKLETLGIMGFVTLYASSQQTEVPNAVIKQIADWEKIKTHEFPYCIISKERSTIYFYV